MCCFGMSRRRKWRAGWRQLEIHVVSQREHKILLHWVRDNYDALRQSSGLT